MRYFLKNKYFEDLDAEASSRPEVKTYQDAVATAESEGLKDLYADSSFLAKVPENHEVLGAVAIDELNT